ncbi:acyltransferase family protein [Nocardioides cavernaquae]|uniref:acyltransferase family protein n=1 Tax=Nocardioides cavernaquae TaxID=2321396 RepID=UPI0015FFADED|nr:acyltransferase family protein [Nocardioides cavernaquae]
MRPTPATDGFRPDIQALRALAVGGVVVFHLWPGALPGGYVGVDVFFVISGFLITGHLLRERAVEGRVHVGHFWARRARRLLPASLLVLLVCTIATVTLVPAPLRLQNLREIAASALYSENWRLALDSVDYLAEENSSSLVRHFWSLSTEEQFYLVVPLLLLAVFAIARRARPERAVAVALGAVVVLSLAYSIWLTETTPGVAYFSTFTRAWEFAAGGLLAAADPRLPTKLLRPAALPARVRAVAVPGTIAWVGIGLVAAAYVAFSGQTAFPGWAAALPVVGTALALWAGPASALARIGAWAPVALVGRVSYAIYLWHWPPIILMPLVTGHDLTHVEKVAIAVTTVAVAWFSTKYVEEPVRFAPRLRGSRTAIAVSAVGVVVVAGLAQGAATAQKRDDERLASTVERFKASPPRCLGAQSRDAALAPCVNHDLDGLLVPQPAVAASDDENRARCWGMERDQARVCTVVAPKDYTRTILTVGDSHANTLIGVYEKVGRAHGWRVMSAGLGGCYLTEAEQLQPSAAHAATCRAWKESVLDWAGTNTPDAVIVTHSSGDRTVVAPADQMEKVTVDGMVAAWERLPDVPVIAIVDNPKVPRDTQVCVDRDHATANERCSVPRSIAFSRFDGQAEAVKRFPRATLVDLSDFYCDETMCPPVIGHVLVYRDASHVTGTWAATLTPYIDRAVSAVMR